MKILKLKVDENGHVMVQDGKPVYVHEDGKEAPFDVNAAMQKIADLNKESMDHRLSATKVVEVLDKYKDKDGNFLDPDVAFKAIETVKNYSDKEMFDATQVESMKSQMNKAYTEKTENLLKAHRTQLDELSGMVNKKDAAIFKLLVKDRFAGSPFVTGKMILPPDIAADYFGGNFKVEGEPDSLRVVGYLGDSQILSRERPGTPASFEEAIEVIVDHYPLKDRIMRGTGTGSGSSGNSGNQGGGFSSSNELSKLPPVERLKEIRKRQQAAG